MKKISEQLRIQAIWHDSVYGYYEYIGTSNALITSTGTKFSKSVKASTERFLMVYLSANMTRRQNSLYHEFIKDRRSDVPANLVYERAKDSRKLDSIAAHF